MPPSLSSPNEYSFAPSSRVTFLGFAFFHIPHLRQPTLPANSNGPPSCSELFLHLSVSIMTPTAVHAHGHSQNTPDYTAHEFKVSRSQAQHGTPTAAAPHNGLRAQVPLPDLGFVTSTDTNWLLTFEKKVPDFVPSVTPTLAILSFVFWVGLTHTRYPHSIDPAADPSSCPPQHEWRKGDEVWLPHSSSTYLRLRIAIQLTLARDCSRCPPGHISAQGRTRQDYGSSSAPTSPQFLAHHDIG